ncbi:MAG: PspC domain-containing protein [Aestuariibacter sp.]|nr:PspC domain-containing protein [Aestuariibacter sp.]
MTNKLTRSNDRMVLGVAAGMAAHTGIDATLIRVLFVLFTLAGGPGLIAYLVMALMMPAAGPDGDIIIETETVAAA